MAGIADLFFRALLDDTTLQRQAETAGDKAGQSLGSRMSTGMSLKMRAGLAVFSAATGLATKGLLELDEITARFRADTGATAEEAERAGKAINAMSGRNLIPMASIGRALAKVHTNMGLVGDQAEKVTERFLKFARVTGRDAADEVEAFDDILDAFGLTAAEIPGIMDKIVASNQKYGGSIAEDESALKRLAPILKSFNLSIDDGIALLDLFKESGIDAARAPQALTAAFNNLNGETFPDFIKRLASIQSQSERTTEAVKVFGSRMGPSFAIAIKPGRDSLDAFRVTEDQTTDATIKAADALDSTFGARAQLAIKGFTSALIDLGQNWGPVVLGISSLASLGGALGLGGFTKDIVTALASAGKQAGEAFIDASSTAVGTLGTVFGNIIARVIDPTEKAFGNPLKLAATKVGAFFVAAFKLAASIASAVLDMFMLLPGMATVVNAVKAAGAKLGLMLATSMFVVSTWASMITSTFSDSRIITSARTAGTAIGTALRLGVLFGLASFADDIQNFLKPIALNVHEFLFGKDSIFGFLREPLEGAGQWLADLPWPLGPKGAPDWAGGKRDAEAGAEGILKAADDVFANAPPIGVKLGPPVPQYVLRQQVQDLKEQYKQAARDIAGAFLGAWDQQPWTQKLLGMGHDLRLGAAQLSLDLAAGLRSGRANITAALNQLRTDMENRLTPKKEVAQRIGQLFNKALAKGLKDADPVIRAQAEGTRALIEDQLIQTVLAGGTAGKRIQEELEAKMHAKDPDVRAQAKRTKALLDAALKAKSEGKTPGDAIGDQLNADLKNKGTELGRTAYQLGRQIYKNLFAGVKGTGYVAPKPTYSGGGTTPTYHPGGGGAQPYQHGTSYVPADQLAFLHQGEAVLTRAEADAMRAGQPIGPVAAGGNTYQTTIVLPERKRDEFEILERASWYQRNGLINPKPRTMPI